MNRYFAALTAALAAAAMLSSPDAARAQALPPTGNALRVPDTPVVAPAAAAPAPPAEPPAPARPSASGDDETPGDDLAPQPAEIRAELETRLKALDASGLSADQRPQAAAFYQQAIKSFDVANGQIAAAAEFKKQLDELPAATADYSARLANPLPPYDDVSGEVLAEIEKRAARVERAYVHASEQLAAMNAEPKKRSQRMTELPNQLAEAQQKLKQAAEEHAALNGADLANEVAAARRAAATQARIEFEATIRALNLERQLYEQGSDLVTLRRDYYARYAPHKKKRLAQLRQEINRRREDEARQQAEAARQVEAAKTAAAKAETRPTAITLIAARNADLAQDRAEIAAAISVVTRQLDARKNELLTLDDQFTRSKKQDEVDELSHLNGQLLRDQQSKLPDVRGLRRTCQERESQRAEMLLRLYTLEDERSALADIEQRADQLAAQAGDLSDATRAEFRQLLETQRAILDPYILDCRDYSSKLAMLQSAETELIATADEYAAFIAERVLWIRSTGALSHRDLRPAADATAWSLDPRHWRDAGLAVLQAAGRRPGQFLLAAIGLAALVAVRPRARRRLRKLGEEADKRSCIRLQPTFDALALTVVMALPWPALLAIAGWSMDSLSESEFVRSLGVSLRFTAVCLLLLELLRHLVRFGGLADCHFDWPDACLVHLRKKLHWLTWIGLPLTLWLVGLEVQESEPLWSSSLGRVAFIAVMLLLAAVMHRVLLARKSPFRQIALVRSGGWLTPLALAWRPAAVLTPAALAALAAVGYYFTALQAAVRVLESAALVLAVLALGGFTRRWLLVNRRRLAREQAKQRRSHQIAAAESDAGAPHLAGELPDEFIDLAAISEQTQKLVRTFLAITVMAGLVLIWKEILPALKYPAARTLPGAELLTWGHLVAFLMVLAVTYVSVRDVPALLELVVLQHLPLDGGSRYAITSLCRYVLAAIGMIAAFNCLGGDWSKIQWLVAAMSVGLGFGLQEIFANFVSGVILLFERPIRVGDVVTLGDKTGVVNRIRMRATTIVDWDRKEYIVPNKDLVTERLLNWTLSDQMNRIEILISVAAGADTDRACTLLLEAAREQPHVLPDPAPSAAFEGFGAAGLTLALRCFLPTLEHRGATIHQLYTTIDRKFRTAGVEIAAPPREMRVRVTRDGKRLHDEPPIMDARRIA